MIEILENSVLTDRFKMSDCMNILNELDTETNRKIIRLSEMFNPKTLTYVIQSLIRFSFLIELVKDDVTSTKFEVRWTTRLTGDPRYASFVECFNIFTNLIDRLLTSNDDEVRIIIGFYNFPLLPYELPIDYIERHPVDGRIHKSENIAFFFNDYISSTLRLRQITTSPEINTEHSVFGVALTDKIKVKTYLTDRALTGAYKTNREKRWETHPNSVQFALRRDCLQIERALILQLCCFRGVPTNFVDYLINDALLARDFQYYCCPITGDELIYEQFRNTILNTQHGLSSFHVGHLNPLKAINEEEVFGHTADNIGWISENGNRIQGSLTMNEVIVLLQRICRNHGWML